MDGWRFDTRELSQLRGQSLLVLAGVAVAVLWVSKGALAAVAGAPLIGQALQLLGIVYVVELVIGRWRSKEVSPA